MRTFILFWNPTISNEKGDRRTEFIAALQEGVTYTADWAVWDWKEARKGDRFYKVMVGNPNPKDNGIVESGFFTSDPYIGEDWSGRGREIHYCDLKYDAMIDFEYISPLTVEKLSQKIPSFDWTGGHSGRLLADDDAITLDTLWCEHLIDAQEGHVDENDFQDENGEFDDQKYDEALYAAGEEAESHIYLCDRLNSRLITWYDPDDWYDKEEEYGPEEDIDYTKFYDAFRVTGLKNIDMNVVLSDVSKIISPEGKEYAIIEMIHDNEDKNILEDSTIYVKGLSAQGLYFRRYKDGSATLQIDWMASNEEIDLAVQLLLALKKHSNQGHVYLDLEDEDYEVTVDEDMIKELKSNRLTSMESMFIENGHRIFGIPGINHNFFISPEEVRKSMGEKNLLDRAVFLRDEFRIVQWAYEDYNSVDPVDIKDPSGEKYMARILTNSGKVFVGHADRLCLITSEKQVKVVPMESFVSTVASAKYFHAVDPVQFTLEQMPQEEWDDLVKSLDGQIMK